MFLSVDIGGTKTFVALFEYDGALVKKERLETNPDYSQFVEELCSAINRIVSDMDDVKAIGVAAPGVMDYETGHVIAFGNLGWKDVDIKHVLASRFNKPVSIDNDGNLGALGEAVSGAGRDYHTVAYITVSTGIGTGFVHDKQLDPILAHSEAGMMHFKHDGKNMLWEKFASGKAFVERFGKQGKDTEEPEIWHEYAQDLAMGFGSIIALIQPDVIVIGGSMGEHLEKYRNFLLGALQDARSPLTPIPKIVQANDPENAVINGAYVAAKRLCEE